MDGKAIYLVGFMGSGKSRVGRELAREIGLEFVDTDEEIARAEGRSIERIFAEDGETAFRGLEAGLIERLVQGPPRVVATGGGLVTIASARRRLRGCGRTVWLDASLDACRRRVGGGVGRPRWSAVDPLDLRALFERRRAVYALADVRVPADGAPGEVVHRVREILGSFR